MLPLEHYVSSDKLEIQSRIGSKAVGQIHPSRDVRKRDRERTLGLQSKAISLCPMG